MSLINMNNELQPFDVGNIDQINLDDILDNAPREILYKSHGNGFYLNNNAVSIRYTQSSFLSRNTVNLWFMETNPKVKVSGSYINMKKLPNSLFCNHVCLHTGSTYSFTIQDPEDEFIIDTFSIFRDDSHGKYPMSYFDKGTELLRKAAFKYNLREYYNMYMKKAQKESLIKRFCDKLKQIELLL